MNTEQERAAFEAWANGRCELHLVNPAGRYSSAITQFAWEAYQAGRAALEAAAREDACVSLVADIRRACGDNFLRMRPELVEYIRELAEDAARFRWLTEDHADAETRSRCREILDRMAVMSYSAAIAAIDAALAAHRKQQEGKS